MKPITAKELAEKLLKYPDAIVDVMGDEGDVYPIENRDYNPDRYWESGFYVECEDENGKLHVCLNNVG